MAQPTANEQYMLELVNRGRQDPLAEAARYNIDLNEGLSPGTISSSPKQPLVFNLNLIDAARNHSQWMLDTDTFSHTGEGGSSSRQRMADAGYQFTGAWSSGENIAWNGTTGTPDLTQSITEQHQNLFLSYGHRVNIMNGYFREIGIGAITGQFFDWNAVMTTQNFATSGSSVFLTGVIYDDSILDDDFYTVGEGLGGITVEAVRLDNSQIFSTSTMDAGGYQIPLDPGNYQVTFSGGGLSRDITQTVTIGTENLKLDLVTDDLPVPLDDNYEENDTQATAYNLSSNEQTWLSNLNGLGVANDSDWYQIYVDSGFENLVVDLQFTHADSDIDLRVYDTFGNVVASATSGSDNEYLDTILASAGTYYLEVYPYSGSGNTYDLWWDDLPAPVPEISIDDVTITESDGGINNAVFTVSLDTVSSNTITVDYYTTDDTAISGSDYNYTSATLTFNPGQTTATVSIPIVDDTSFESDESFFVNLYNPTNANISDSQGIGTILNDDGIVINGTPNNDKLKGTAKDEIINGFEGNDKIKGNDGNDTLNGGEGNDKLDAGNGDDYLDGGAGNDQLKGVNGNNTLVGGTGNDKITGGKGIDILIGVDPNSSIAGRGEVDTLKASKGADVFVLGNEFGAFYNDGNNSNAGESDYALIKDFKLSDGDVIQLAGSASDYVLGAAGKHTEIFLETAGVDELIAVLQKVNPSDLDLNSSSFSFV